MLKWNQSQCVHNENNVCLIVKVLLYGIVTYLWFHIKTVSFALSGLDVSSTEYMGKTKNMTLNFILIVVGV